MQRTRIKICGITNPEDAEAAQLAGADALGFNFFKGSPRYVEPTMAVDAIRAVAPFVTVVGLFVNSSPADIATVLRQVPIDLLQFSGDETNEFCRSFDRPFVKAIRAESLVAAQREGIRFPDSRGLLVDALVTGRYGGTGQTVPWTERVRYPGLILAGGLRPDNVAQAIRTVRPWAVDVSSGVESVRARKDHQKIQAFVAAVWAVDKELANE